MNIVQKPVKNRDLGRFGYKPEAIVIHIAEGYLGGAHSWFNNPASFASSHYMVGKTGEIWQFVDDENTSWHAGVVLNPSWSLLKPGVNPNFYTFGIEHEGFTGEPWTNSMTEASAELVGTLCRRYKIPLDRNHIIGHYQINSINRSNCPGTGVNLDNLINLALKYYEDPAMIKELQDQITKLQSEITDLEKEITVLKKNNSELEGRLSNIKNPTEAQKEVVKLTQEIKKLQKNELSYNKTINQLKAENVELKKGSTSGIGSLLDSIFGKITKR
jgi:N-acetyl-anhydromuramyl-L-alanine amidase AmpD